jgi:hypothetical protein
MLYEVSYRITGTIKFPIEAPSVDEAERIAQEIYDNVEFNNSPFMEDMDGYIIAIRTKK